MVCVGYKIYGTNRKMDIKIPLSKLLLCISSRPKMIFTFIRCKLKTMDHLEYKQVTSLNLFIILYDKTQIAI